MECRKCGKEFPKVKNNRGKICDACYLEMQRERWKTLKGSPFTCEWCGKVMDGEYMSYWKTRVCVYCAGDKQKDIKEEKRKEDVLYRTCRKCGKRKHNSAFQSVYVSFCRDCIKENTEEKKELCNFLHVHFEPEVGDPFYSRTRRKFYVTRAAEGYEQCSRCVFRNLPLCTLNCGKDKRSDKRDVVIEEYTGEWFSVPASLFSLEYVSKSMVKKERERLNGIAGNMIADGNENCGKRKEKDLPS